MPKKIFKIKDINIKNKYKKIKFKKQYIIN